VLTPPGYRDEAALATASPKDMDFPGRHADYRKHQPDVLGDMKEVRANPGVQLSNF